jgi:hypothetical protein
MPEPRKERRRYAHISLPKPIPGRLGSLKVYVLDVSINGARVAHQSLLTPGDDDVLRFEWEGQELAFETEVVRTEPQPPAGPNQPPLFHTGLFFLEPVGMSGETLKELVTDYVMRALDEQKSNARGIPPIAPTYYQSGLKDKGYVSYRLVQGSWKKTYTPSSDQPADGFTVSVREPQEQIDMLCQTYQQSDFSGRKMIRKMAELSINSIEAVAARKYHP